MSSSLFLSKLTRKIPTLLLIGFLVFSSGALLFAAAPNGGYNPGDTLDPDCAPGDTDCFVTLGSGGATVANGLQIISGDIALGGELTEIVTVIDAGDVDTQTLAFGLNTPFEGFYIGGNNIDIVGNNFIVDTTNQISLQSQTLSTNGNGEFRIGQLTTMFGAMDGIEMVNNFSSNGNDYTQGLIAGDVVAFNNIPALVIQLLNETNSKSTFIRMSDATPVAGDHTLTLGVNTSGIPGNDASAMTVSDTAITFSFAGSQTFSIPTTQGTNGYVLQTDGSGNVSWVAGGSGAVYAVPGTVPGAISLFDTTAGAESTGVEQSVFFGLSAGYQASNIQRSLFIGPGAGYQTQDIVDSNFLGSYAGAMATFASNSNFLGSNAGGQATGANNSNFLGQNAGNGATDASSSNFLGFNAGSEATNAFSANFFGQNAGAVAANAANSNFFGQNAGAVAANAANSNFFGAGAGSGATDASFSNFFGAGAGREATNAVYANFFGGGAGYQATGANNANFFGQNAGNGATDASNSNFFGSVAGYGATGANNANFFGAGAGQEATNAVHANFFGVSAGASATDAMGSNFFGQNAGAVAANAANSNFFGAGAGSGATDASFSNFFGAGAGSGATDAKNSIFIGTNSGVGDLVVNTAANTGENCNVYDCYSILLGPQTATNTFSNSIAIGAYATNTAANQFMIGSTTRPISEMRIILDDLGGECTIDIGGAACSSDETLKKDINTIPNALDIVTQLDGVTYHWLNDDAEKIKTPGFIAQDVATIIPEAVRYNRLTGKYAMNYTQIIPYLVEAIKQLNIAMVTGTNAGASVGELVVESLKAQRVQTEVLCVGSTCLTEKDLRALGIGGSTFEPRPRETAPESNTGTPSDAETENTSEVTTPTTPSDDTTETGTDLLETEPEGEVEPAQSSEPAEDLQQERPTEESTTESLVL